MEPFKNFYSPELVRCMAEHVARLRSDFQAEAFVTDTLDGWEGLELKQRSARITQMLERHVRADFEGVVEVALGVLGPAAEGPALNGRTDAEGVAGWGVVPLADWVSSRAGTELEAGLAALKVLTRRFSAEFAIRPLIARDPQRALATIAGWVSDPDVNVRRLASEGTRPRLPWGLRLQAFVEDPQPLLPLLTALRDDPELYVRRSVANSLNDIAKDHPDWVAELAGHWMEGATAERAQLVRHACRTLVKQGHPGALAALGFGPPEVELLSWQVHTPELKLGQTLRFSVTLRSKAKSAQPVVVDYALGYRKANGSLGPKVFKWKRAELGPGETVTWTREQKLKPVSTRTHYTGAHTLVLQVNGQPVGTAGFHLEVE